MCVCVCVVLLIGVNMPLCRICAHTSPPPSFCECACVRKKQTRKADAAHCVSFLSFLFRIIMVGISTNSYILIAMQRMTEDEEGNFIEPFPWQDQLDRGVKPGQIFGDPKGPCRAGPVIRLLLCDALTVYAARQCASM